MLSVVSLDHIDCALHALHDSQAVEESPYQELLTLQKEITTKYQHAKPFSDKAWLLRVYLAARKDCLELLVKQLQTS
jgi:hypothetical protein